MKDEEREMEISKGIWDKSQKWTRKAKQMKVKKVATVSHFTFTNL